MGFNLRGLVKTIYWKNKHHSEVKVFLSLASVTSQLNHPPLSNSYCHYNAKANGFLSDLINDQLTKLESSYNLFVFTCPRIN